VVARLAARALELLVAGAADTTPEAVKLVGKAAEESDPGQPQVEGISGVM